MAAKPPPPQAKAAPQAHKPQAHNTQAHNPQAQQSSQASSPAAAPNPPPFLQPPRITTDNPWRHLHPARVWPD